MDPSRINQMRLRIGPRAANPQVTPRPGQSKAHPINDLQHPVLRCLAHRNHMQLFALPQPDKCTQPNIAQTRSTARIWWLQ